MSAKEREVRPAPTPGPQGCPSSWLKKSPLCLSPGCVTLCCSHPGPRCSPLPGLAGFGFGFGFGTSQGLPTGQALPGVSSGPCAGDPPFPTPTPPRPPAAPWGRRGHSPAQRRPLSAPDQPNGDQRVRQTQGHVKGNLKTDQTHRISVLGNPHEELTPRVSLRLLLGAGTAQAISFQGQEACVVTDHPAAPTQSQVHPKDPEFLQKKPPSRWSWRWPLRLPSDPHQSPRFPHTNAAGGRAGSSVRGQPAARRKGAAGTAAKHRARGTSGRAALRPRPVVAKQRDPPSVAPNACLSPREARDMGFYWKPLYF